MCSLPQSGWCLAFKGKTLSESLPKLRENYVPPLGDVCQSMDDRLASAISKLLEKSPQKRFDSATSLRQSLLALLQEQWSKHLDNAIEFQTSIGVRFRLVPPAEFMMGASRVELKELGLDPKSGSSPKHLVRLTKPFYISVNEVSAKQYEQLMGTVSRKQFMDTRDDIPIHNIAPYQPVEVEK